MNLVAMIEAASRHHQAELAATPPHPRLKNLLLGGPAQSIKARARYRAVMSGRGWMTQRRNRGGVATYARRIGYEWRWVE